MTLSSPFQRVPGTFKYGDLTYEWRTLLNTPCYGFNGPNACYSSTCKHDGSTSMQKQQQQPPPPPPPSQQQQQQQPATKRKTLSLSKLSMKFNWRTVPGNGTDSDSGIKNVDSNEHMVSVASTATKSLLTEQMNVYVSSNMYSDPSILNGGYVNFDDRSTRGQSIQQYFHAPSTIEVNVHVGSPNAAFYSSSSSTSPMFVHRAWSSSESSCDGTSFDSSYDFTSTIQHSGGSSSNSSSIGSTKSYVFNPLSKPFHPMKRKNNSDVIPCTAIEAPETEIENQSINDDSFSTCSEVICPPSKYVCILCPKSFSTAIELKQHIENKSQQPFDCVLCGITFTHNYQLQRHLWTHLKNHRRIRPFDCRACQKKFRTLNQLHKHYELCQYKLYIFY